MSLKQILNNAEDAAVDAIIASEDVPETAREFIAASGSMARLTVETSVDSHVLGHVALDFDRIIRRELARNMAEAVSQKLQVTYNRADGFPPLSPVHVYRGEVYAFTRDELIELVDDAMRAGRLTA